MDETCHQLLLRLHALLQASHGAFGATVDTVEKFDGPDLEVFPIGEGGVLAFIHDYAICGWEDDDRAAPHAAYTVLHDRLRRRGFTRHMVHPRNLRSVRLTRKLGAEPQGVDSDGYMHYVLTLERFEQVARDNLSRKRRRSEISHG